MTSARYREQEQTNPPRIWHVEWGGVGFNVLEPEPPFGFAESPSEVLSHLVDDLTAGLRSVKGIGDWSTEDRTHYYKNTGIYGLWLPEPVGVKSYAITTQTAVVAVDHSGVEVGNRRVHAAMWPTSSGERFIAGLLGQIYKDTSVSNPAITTPSTADNVSDDCMGLSVGQFGGSTVMVYVSDGQTDDAKYTTDPTANSISWTSLITYPNAADFGQWLYFIPTLGDGGRWVFNGKLNNGTPALYSFKPTDTAPLTISTMQPVVYEATKDLEGSISTVTTSAISPGSGAPYPRSGDTLQHGYQTNSGGAVNAQSDAWWDGWSNGANITASDDSRATAQSNFKASAGTGDTISAPEGVLSDELWAIDFNFSSVPLAAIITGLQADPEVSEADAGDDISWALARFAVEGSQVGFNLADGSELPTTEASKTFGGSSDRVGTDLRGHQIQYGLAFAMQFRADEGATRSTAGTTTNTGSARVDHVTVTLTYRFPGVQVETTEGAWSFGPMPSTPNFIPEVRPVSDDATGVNTRRELVIYELLFDQLDRVTVDTVHQPDLGGGTVVHGCHFQGGLAVAVASDIGDLLRFYFTRLEGGVFVADVLNFPGTHAGVVQDVYFMAEQDKDLIVGVCTATERQLWKFNFDTGWHPFGVQQSISGTTMDTKPIRYAEYTLGTEQNHAYAFIPDGSSNLDIAREFVPPDFNQDPREVNTSQAKNATATRVTLLQLDFNSPNSQGPWFKVLLNSQVRTDEVDDATTYDSVRHLFDHGGSYTFGTTGAYDHTFEAGFTPFFIASGGLPFNHGIIGLEAGASTGTKTPNILPALFQFASQTEADRTFPLLLAPSQDIQDIVRRLETAKRSDAVRPLIFPVGFPYLDQSSNRNVPSLFIGATRQRDGTAQITFREVPGASA